MRPLPLAAALVELESKAFAGQPWMLHLPTELVCEDCMAGDHRTCREAGGYMDDEDNTQRCGCHLTEHALDNREQP